MRARSRRWPDVGARIGDRITEAAGFIAAISALGLASLCVACSTLRLHGMRPRCECNAIPFVGDVSPRLPPNPARALSSLSQIYEASRPAPQFTHDDPEHTLRPDR